MSRDTTQAARPHSKKQPLPIPWEMCSGSPSVPLPSDPPHEGPLLGLEGQLETSLGGGTGWTPRGFGMRGAPVMDSEVTA